MYQNISTSTVKDLLAKHFGWGATPAEIRKVPTGKFNSTFFAKTPENEFVIRIAPPDGIGYLFYEVNMMAQEPAIHKLLRLHTTIPVPEIYVYDTTRDIIASDFLIMERMPGTPATDVFLSPQQWNRALFQVGQFLAQAHARTTEFYGYVGEHKPMPPGKSWQEAFDFMWETMIRQIIDMGAYTGDEGNLFLSAYEKHRHLFTYAGPPRLLHMDVWAQNILVDESGNVTGLLDWDRALWGDPEIEFAVLDYCGISEPAFWEGYGQQRDDSPEANIRHIFYYLYEVQKYIVIRGTRGRDWSRAMEYKQASLSIARKIF